MDSKWGIYPWFVEHGIDLIHPDDFEAFKQEVNNSKVFECIETGDYITLKYNNNSYRARDTLFKPVPAPKYNFGKVVKIKEKEEEAVITDIMWHYSKHQHYYFVSVKNKKNQGDIGIQTLCKGK